MADAPGLLGTLLGKLGNAQSSPLFNLGVGMMMQPKYSPVRRGGAETFGGAMAYASRATQEAAQAQYLRDRMLQEQKTNAAQAQFRELILSGKIAPPPGVDPESFAASYAADPDAFGKAYAQSIFPQKYDPATEVEILKIRADIDRQRAEAEKAQREAKSGAAAEETKLTGAASAIKSITGAGTRLSERKSPLAPGSNVAPFLLPLVKGAGWLPGGAEVVEAATGASQADVVDRETIGKNAAALVSTLTPMAQQTSGGSVLGLTLAEQASANLSLQWETIRRILIQNTTQAIREAERKGVEIPDEAELRKGLDELRAQDEAYTKSGGKIDQAAIDKYTPTDEMVAAEAKKRGLSVGAPGGGGGLTTQPGPVYTPITEQGGDVEMPPAAVAPAPAPVAPPAQPPGVFGMPPSFSSVPSFADIFGGAKSAVEAVPGLAQEAVRQVKTVPIPAVPTSMADVPPEVKNTVQQGVADARPLIHQAIKTAREVGDKVAVAGNEIYTLGGRKVADIENGVAVLKNASDLGLVKTEALLRRGINRIKIVSPKGIKILRWEP